MLLETKLEIINTNFLLCLEATSVQCRVLFDHEQYTAEGNCDV